MNELTPAMRFILEDIATKPVPTELVTVNSELADYWLSNYKYNNQRPVREFNVIRLQDAMRLGTFKLSEVKFAVTPDGEFYLINGQHRLTAIIRYGKGILLQVTVVMVSSKEEVAEYYIAEDRGLGRSLTDTYQAMELASRIGVSRSSFAPLSAALIYIQSDLNGSKAQTTRKNTTDGRRVAMLQEWASEIRDIDQYCARGGRGKVNATFWVNTALAVQLITLRYQNILAKQFWSSVVSGEGLLRGTAAYALSQYCQTRDKITGVNDQEHVARAFSLAWGHFFKKTQTFVIQPGRMNFDNPFPIIGTPYNGNQWGRDPKWYEPSTEIKG